MKVLQEMILSNIGLSVGWKKKHIEEIRGVHACPAARLPRHLWAKIAGPGSQTTMGCRDSVVNLFWFYTSSHHWHGVKATICGKIPNLLGNCEVKSGRLCDVINSWFGIKVFSLLACRLSQSICICSPWSRGAYVHPLFFPGAGKNNDLHSMFSLELALESRTLCQRFASRHWLQSSMIFFHYTCLTSYLLTATPPSITTHI